MHPRPAAALCCIALALAGCAQTARQPAPPPAVATPPEPIRPRFTVEASKNDTWNAVGQLLVRTPGVEYNGRAQMLGLYAIRYRGTPVTILTRALPLSDTITRTTTEVTVTMPKDQAAAGTGVAELLALLERALPAEIESVKARFAAEKQAKAKAKTKTKARRKKASKK